MHDITSSKPPDFSPILTVSVEKHFEVWPLYVFISFSLLVIAIGFLPEAREALLAGPALLAISLFMLWIQIRVRRNPHIIVASQDGIWFPHCKLYIPWESTHTIGDVVEKGSLGVVGNVTIKRLALYFELSSEQLSTLKRRLIWPKKVGWNERTNRAIVSLPIPYTVGKGQMLNLSKEALLERITALIQSNARIR